MFCEKYTKIDTDYYYIIQKCVIVKNNYCKILINVVELN